MVAVVTDLPFQLGEMNTVVVRDLLVLRCEGCSKYALEDSVMARVDATLEQAVPSAELEIRSSAKPPVTVAPTPATPNLARYLRRDV
jgi:hypothetical protein